MKADPFVQLRLLDLQVLDTGLAQLAHRRTHLPEIAEMARLEGLVEGTRDRIVALETEAGDLGRTTRKFEEEIAQVRARKQRNDERLASGAITQSKQLEEIQHENGSLDKRQSDLEDQELEVLERAEQVQADLDVLVDERDGWLRERSEAEVARDKAWAEVDADIERSTGERRGVAAEIPADLLALYDKIRAAEGGIGAGAIGQGRCGACRLDLMNNEKADIRAAAPDEVLRHDECRRIMVRTAESGL